jgi:hypothetical protein
VDSESYLIDHEAETSIKYLALQLLPSPLSPLTWSRPHTSSSIGFASSSWPSLRTIEIQEQVRRDDAPRVRRPPVFNVTLSVSHVIKVYGEAFAQSIVAQLLAAILIVMQFRGGLGWLKKSKFGPILYHDVIFGDASYRIMDFNALEGWVSFHHLLHWLLGGAVLACGSVAR